MVPNFDERTTERESDSNEHHGDIAEQEKRETAREQEQSKADRNGAKCQKDLLGEERHKGLMNSVPEVSILHFRGDPKTNKRVGAHLESKTGEKVHHQWDSRNKQSQKQFSKNVTSPFALP